MRRRGESASPTTRPKKMVTGVWSKRIKEANESNGLQPGPAMACAMGILCGVIGLGLKYKLRMLAMFAREVTWNVHGRRVEEAQRAFARNQKARYDRAYRQRERQSTSSSRDWDPGWHFNARSRTAEEEAALAQCRELLGVQRGARKAELKAAYYRAAKRLHPDSGNTPSGGAASGELFAKLKSAYDTLKEVAPS